MSIAKIGKAAKGITLPVATKHNKSLVTTDGDRLSASVNIMIYFREVKVETIETLTISIGFSFRPFAHGPAPTLLIRHH